MDMSTNLEKVYDVKVFETPVGLGGMILAGNISSAIVAELLKKVEGAMKITDPMQSTLLRIAGTFAAAFATANYLGNVVGKRTANLASGIIIANGASETLGGMFGSKKSLTEQVTEFTRKLAPMAEEEAPATVAKIVPTVVVAPAAAVAKKIAGYGDYDGYGDNASSIGYLPEIPSFYRRPEMANVAEMIG